MQPKYPKQKTPKPRYPAEIPRRPIPYVPDERNGRLHGSIVTWVCSRCGTPNGLYRRSCEACGEANPRWVNTDNLSIVNMTRKIIDNTAMLCPHGFKPSGWKLVFEVGAMVEFRNELALELGHVCKDEFAEKGTFMGIKVVVLPGLEPGDVFLLPKNTEEL